MVTIGNWWYRRIDADGNPGDKEHWLLDAGGNVTPLPEGCMVCECDFINQFIDRANLHKNAQTMLNIGGPSYLARAEPGQYRVTSIVGLCKEFIDFFRYPFWGTGYGGGEGIWPIDHSGLYVGSGIVSGSTVLMPADLVSSYEDVPAIDALLDDLAYWLVAGRFLPGLFEKMRSVLELVEDIPHIRQFPEELFWGDMGIASSGRMAFTMYRPGAYSFTHSDITFPISNAVIFNAAYEAWIISTGKTWSDLYPNAAGMFRRNNYGDPPDEFFMEMTDPKIKLKAPVLPIDLDWETFVVGTSPYDYYPAYLSPQNALVSRGSGNLTNEGAIREELTLGSTMGPAGFDGSGMATDVQDCRDCAAVTLKVNHAASGIPET